MELGVFSVMMEGGCSRSWQTGVQFTGAGVYIKPTGKSVQFTAILTIFVFKEGTRLPLHTRSLHAVYIIYLPYVGVLYSSCVQRMLKMKLGL